MKRILLPLIAGLCLANLVTSTAFADDLDTVTGKWTTKRKTPDGTLTETLEIKKDRFTFKIVGEDDSSVLYGEGDVKSEKSGSIQYLSFTNIKGGKSSDDIKPVDDDRACPYRLEDGKLYLAINFDKERDKAPYMETFKKAEATAKR
jgi:hypothetical protein